MLPILMIMAAGRSIPSMSGSWDLPICLLMEQVSRFQMPDLRYRMCCRGVTVCGSGRATGFQSIHPDIILASIELAKRYTSQTNKKITSAEEIYQELKAFSTKQQEYFLTITLDGASHIINTRTVFIGTLNQTLVHPREVFADAIADRAAGIIIAHNHPSGTLRPSRADMQITDRLSEVSKLVGIELLDHVIIAKGGFYSFSDEGLL
ncbi:MAG TPA: DNA repair protein RadC [Campylobacterales bacterium]|nr:DNA repair protein RadC [Campylobacterales bacterium]